MPKSKALVPFIRGYQIVDHDVISRYVLSVRFTGLIHQSASLPVAYRRMRMAGIDLEDVIEVGLDIQEYWKVEARPHAKSMIHCGTGPILWLSPVCEEDL